MQKIAVLTDSGCDVPASYVRSLGIHVLPLKITYPDGVYSDLDDIEPRDVYARFPAQIPKTSTPNIAEVLDQVELLRAQGYTHIIAVCISSGLSGTFNTVSAAFCQVHDMQTYAFDTRNISIGAGIFALLAVSMAARGESFDTIVRTLEEKRADAKIYYYMDTLDYLVAGGRIGRVAGAIGGVLKLKPIISCNEDGEYYPVAVLKNKQRALQKLINHAARFAGSTFCTLALMHGDAPSVAQSVAPMLRESIPNAELLVQGQIAASLAVHTGPGLIGIMAFRGQMP